MPFLRVFTMLAFGISILFVASCSQNDDPGPPSTIPISNCIVNADKDIIIGDVDDGANPGCDWINIEETDTGGSYGEIIVEDGGLLTIGALRQPLASTPTAKNIILAGNSEPLEFESICITDGGTMRVGTPDRPITAENPEVIRFKGDKSTPGSEEPDCQNEGPDKNQSFRKGIDVAAGGTLEIYGAKGVPEHGGVSWTTLAEPAGITVPGAKVASTGEQTLELTDDVTAGISPWQSGDWIVISTTSFSPFESEFVQIDSVTKKSSGGSTVQLKQPLKYYHFGSLPPSEGTCPDPFDNAKTQPAFLCDGPDRNYGVDERAEVGLITRDVVLTSITPDAEKVDSQHWGGEIKIHAGFEKVVLQGVQLQKFGKDQMGSYPIHFHQAGNIEKAKAPVIDANSIDHSYNKCITLHETSNVTVSNLVCARILGQIFYEELASFDADNVADNSGIVFEHNLGIGAMSNSFDIYPVTKTDGTKISRQALIDQYWWTGDYMTNNVNSASYINYDGFNIPNMDNQAQPVGGSCTQYTNNGSLVGQTKTVEGSTFTPCGTGSNAAFPVHFLPANGFWILNPKTHLIDNAIAGCQGVGRAYWWLTPPDPIRVNGQVEDPKFFKLGTVKGNRASACYSGFYAEGEYGVRGGQLFPHKDGTLNSPSIIATLDGITATRNRFRGLWMRPTWFVIKNGHFASNRDSVTLVTSGGIEGNAPGVWELIENSAIIGFSQNNVDRWGPCPQADYLGPNTGAKLGCIDQTKPPADVTPHSGEEIGEGYPTPRWNNYGYMLYDGPVRVFHDRFINFNYDQPIASGGSGEEFSSQLDDKDKSFLQTWQTTQESPTSEGPPTPYEGDAALGWFQSNQSAYPTATASRELMWVNTNLRHQIYTEKVSVNTDFNDGDKNTAIIDEDGTLSGLEVQFDPDADPSLVPVHPISLNNLPFNSTSNAVDECLSRGGQNEAYEGRDSSLMSPAEMGTLEFSSLYPFKKNGNDTSNYDDYPGDGTSHWQNMTFKRDDPIPDGKGGSIRPEMTLQTGRDGRGIWEPKVSNGYGYTVSVDVTTSPSAPADQKSGKAGIAKWIDVGLADVVDPNITASRPFFVQLGICYTSKNDTHPAADFTIKRGYKSYAGGSIWVGGTEAENELLKYWTWLPCNNLDSLNPSNVPHSGNSYDGTCPATSNGKPVTSLTPASSIGELTNSDGSPNLDVYYYNASTGMLYLNVVQDEPNPVAPSPTGSCGNGNDPDDPSCPHHLQGESYYACPKNGCIIYTIAQNDPNYDPGPSKCAPLETNLKAAPARPNKLVNKQTKAMIIPETSADKQGDPYNTAVNGPTCSATQP